MKIVLTAVAVFDSIGNATAIRTKVESVEAYKGDGTERVIHDRVQEVLWDDTHEIAVRCQMMKAIERWAEQMWSTTNPF